jgi:outer membrane lipoprotein-sorting protein
MTSALLLMFALAADPTADELLAKYDSVMGPKTFDSEMSMSAHREDGSDRAYVMRVLKGEGDKIRIWFNEPAAVKGQEMLRNGDNLWLYLPNLKRATRVANRDSFQGGDFNNADVLRVNYQADYTAKLGASDIADAHLIELKAKNTNTAYDSIKLWLRKSDAMPLKGQYFGTSGQMIRSAEFTDFKQFDKSYQRPSKVKMRNELVKERYSEMTIKTMKLDAEVPAQRFTQADMGR